MKRIRFFIFFSVFCVGLASCVLFGVKWTIEDIVRQNALEKAERWAEVTALRVPRLPSLIATGIPDAEQADVLRDLGKLGDVFEFELFDAEGRLVIIIDGNATQMLGVSETPDEEAARVLAHGRPIVDFTAGGQNSEYPEYYAEAYVPVVASDGALLGVVEVYVDQTATYGSFVTSFTVFGVMLALACTAVVAVPSLAYAFERRNSELAQSDAAYLARYDALTGLLNRRAFLERLADPSLRVTAVAYLDVDRFKLVNDTHGHVGGDTALVHVAEALKSFADTDNMVSRFGGDEFVLALSAAKAENIDRVMAELLEKVRQKFLIDGREVSCSVSIGVCFLVGADNNVHTALKRADTALYSAKEAGRNQYAIYGTALSERLTRRSEVERLVRAGIADGNFELYFQPLVHAQGEHILGYEALLRLTDETGAMVSPVEFVPVAEEFGLIDGIGRWVIERATQHAARWSGGQKVSVNLSPLQFDSGELPQIVRQALGASGLEPKLLELEITESLLLTNSTSVALQLDELQDVGVNIVLDDFGTGFSSLAYLWQYGFNKLKIDQSFIAALESSPEKATEIIESIVLLCKRLGMSVTAEGIETKEQAAALRDLGCDELQGFYYGHPSSAQNETQTKRAANAAQ